MIETFTCHTCKLMKPSTSFNKDKKSKIGFYVFRCKDCFKQYNKEYMNNPSNALKKKVYNLQWNKLNPLSVAYKSYKSDAKRRNIIWNLTKQEFNDFSGGNCYYCNSEILLIGLDRINNDPTVGYTKENICRCCSICNRMKSNMSIDNFLSHISKIKSR